MNLPPLCHQATLLTTHPHLHDEEDDQDDDASYKTQEAQEETLGGPLAVNPPVAEALLGVQGPVAVEVLVAVDLLALLHLLDLVLADVLPHDVRHGSCDQAEVEFDLDPGGNSKAG